jgi:hypothetical protein
VYADHHEDVYIAASHFREHGNAIHADPVARALIAEVSR